MLPLQQRLIVGSEGMAMFCKILLLVAVGTCWAPQMSANSGCPTTGIVVPIEMTPKIKNQFSIQDLKIAAWNSLDASFIFENRSDKPISSLTLVLEYRTRDRDYSLPVVYEAAPDTKQPSDYLIPTERVEALPQPILPGESKAVHGVSPYTPPSCPTSARLTMLDIRFIDQTKFTWTDPKWWTPPLLADYPEEFEIPEAANWKPHPFLVRIAPDGSVDRLTPLDSSQGVISESIAKTLRKLSFAPATEDGHARFLSVVFIVDFVKTHDDSCQKRIKTADLQNLMVCISFYPNDAQKRKWWLNFGRGFGYKSTQDMSNSPLAAPPL